MGIVDNIKELCKENNTTIPRVEKELGFGNGGIYSWNKSSPTIKKLQKVADYFNVPISRILGENTDLLEEEFPEGVKVLRRATKELTPQARAKMIKLMNAFIDEE